MMLSIILLSILINSTLKCDQASNMWQQLEFTSELEFDLQDTVDWGRK